ncbi:hypothetical protein PCE31106_04572 [Pandoraea cepalis]|uniref:Uncharacterized protein n=1 Tax=Pandoraea cepalis TaxID=2508294 RepID=A0A5E4YKK2_9BURK|nr:hypothetical protein [Pandoraea cepalis]VVE49269.1 hypothetical protein PCE31106_04572 [Pandoraea cepalis]
MKLRRLVGSDMVQRLVYQSAFFANNTLIYAMIAHSHPGKGLLFFSLFLAAMSLRANLGLQLRNFGCTWCEWVVRLASLLIFVASSRSVSFEHQALTFITIVLVVAFFPTRLLLEPPSLVKSVIIVTSIGISAGLVVVDYLGLGSPRIATQLWLPLLLAPYVVAMGFGLTGNTQAKIEEGVMSPSRLKTSALLLIISGQLIPVLSGTMLVVLAAGFDSAQKVGNYIAMERSLAIGGTLAYFAARVALPKNLPVLLRWLAGFVVASGIAWTCHTSPWVAIPGLFSAGVFLSLSTIALNRSGGERRVFIANTIAFCALFSVWALSAGPMLGASVLMVVYILPQLLVLIPAVLRNA